MAIPLFALFLVLDLIWLGISKMEHGKLFDESWTFAKMKKVGTVREIDSYQPASRVTAGSNQRTRVHTHTRIHAYICKTHTLITDSTVGHNDEMDEKATAHLQAMWNLHMKETGCRDYIEFANKCRQASAVQMS